MKHPEAHLVVYLKAILACTILAACTAVPVQMDTPVVAGAAVVTATPTVWAGVPTSAEVVPTPVTGIEPPLRFTFPTPAPEPLSLWRPPLYPLPWALGPYDHFFFARPIAADEVNWPLADYRYGGIFFGWNIIHTGVDIPVPKGTPIYAAAGGKVVWAGNGLYTSNPEANDPYGLAVVIRHDFGYNGRRLHTVYAHMDRVDVIYGQRVETGTQLGVVGTTGATTGPHVHFEVRIETNSFYATRNPELWMAPPQGWGVLVGRVLNTNGSILERKDLQVFSIETGQKWNSITYGGAPANSDEYYRENMVLSDLPAGFYLVSIEYLDEKYEGTVYIPPGGIGYFTFRGAYGFDFSPPSLPGPEDWLQ